MIMVINILLLLLLLLLLFELLSRRKAENSTGKRSFNRKRSIFCGPLEKELRKKLVKCFTWSVVLYGAETWTLRRNEQKRLESFEMWIRRRMERVKWTDKIKNAVVLERAGEGRIMLVLTKKRKRNWLDHWLRRNCLLKDALEGMVNGKKVRGKRRCQMIDNIVIYGLCEDTKRKAEKRVEWKMLSLQVTYVTGTSRTSPGEPPMHRGMKKQSMVD